MPITVLQSRFPLAHDGMADLSVPKPVIIVFGNEKGGSGKTTTAMHVLVALMRLGQKVAAIDLDSRQRSFARYLENRAAWAERRGQSIALPVNRVIGRSREDRVSAAEAEERAWFDATIAELGAEADAILIDTPGSDTFLSRLAHQAADVIVTPINDSFVDFDLLGVIDPESFNIVRPSIYSELVWESRKRRAMARKRSTDWVILRNRTSNLDTRNKRKIADVLERLAPRVGFRVAPGFTERVIYRELFPLGLTLFDLADADTGIALTMSHVAARQEVRELLLALKLPGLDTSLSALDGGPQA